MKKYTHHLISACLLGLLFASSAAGQEDPMQDPRTGQLMEAFDRAIEELQAGDHDKAIATYNESLAKLERYDWLPDEIRDELAQLGHYNLACAYSLKKDTAPALEHFERSLELGFADWAHIQQDTDLDNIRDEDAFKEVVAHFAHGGGPRNPAHPTPPARPTPPAHPAPRTDAHAAAKAHLLAQVSDKALFDFAFDLETTDGKTVKLADLKGKVVLVDVWGTWCPPCRKEVPHLVELYRKHREKGFVIVGLNSEHIKDSAEATKVVQKFRKDHGIEYPCALTPRSIIDTIPEFRGFPTMLLVDRQGRVRLKHVGYTPGEVLEAPIEKLLAEEAPAKKSAPKEPALF